MKSCEFARGSTSSNIACLFVLMCFWSTALFSDWTPKFRGKFFKSTARVNMCVCVCARAPRRQALGLPKGHIFHILGNAPRGPKSCPLVTDFGRRDCQTRFQPPSRISCLGRTLCPWFGVACTLWSALCSTIFVRRGALTRARLSQMGQKFPDFWTELIPSGFSELGLEMFERNTRCSLALKRCLVRQVCLREFKDK